MSGLSQKTWWNKCSQIVRQRVYSKIFLPVPAPVVSNKEDEFSKKQECGKLTTQITQTLKNRDVPYNDGFAIHSSLDKVFYSVKQNSCLYTTNIYALADKKLIVSYGLYDALSNEIIKVVNLDGTKAENDQSANEFLNFAISYGY